MMEFIQFAFAPANVLFTFLLCMVLLYWLAFVIGVMDMDILNFDFDLDIEAEGEVDANIVPDMGGALHAMLAFFYVGQVPVTILVTLLASTLWIISMMANLHINPTGGFWLGLPVAGANFVASMFVVKVVGYPIGLLFGALHANPDQVTTVVGSLCVIISESVSDEMGQARIKTKASPIVMNVVTRNGEKLHKGDEAVVMERDENRGLYIIAPVDMEKEL